MTHPEQTQTDEADALLAQMQRNKRTKNISMGLFLLALAAGALWVLYVVHFEQVFREWSVTLAQSGDHTPVSTDALTRVHTKLIPDWVILKSRAKTPKRKQRAARAHKLILDELSSDPGAQALMERLGELVEAPQLLPERIEDIRQLVDTWNARMEKQGQPWWLEVSAMGRGEDMFFYTKSYRVLSDVSLKLGAQAHRTRIVARADETNIVESLLGHTKPGQEGAMILADRITDFSLHQVWPLLAPVDERTSIMERNFAPLIAQQAQNTLSADALATLQQTAPAQRALTRTLDAVRARAECGSRFMIAQPGIQGVPVKDFDLLKKYAHRDRMSACPSIKAQEVDSIIDASDALRTHDGLQEAVEALASMVSRGVAVHEARHDADHKNLGGFDDPLPCAPCEGKLSKRSRAELSAYLASFAVKSVGPTALFQACSLDLRRNTPHAIAMRTALPLLGMESCDAPVPANFSRKAQDAEMDYFGRSEMITIPQEYPARLPLSEHLVRQPTPTL